MKRILREFEFVLMLLFVVGLTVACPKKETGPPPEPTPAAEPTAAPAANVATCYVPVPAGTPPVCKNALGDHVVCPTDEKTLPVCQ